MGLLNQYQSTFGEEQLKAEIQEVVRAYRHSWDIYSELLQNAVDSINRRYLIYSDPEYYLYKEFRERYPEINTDLDYRGEIKIIWDCEKRQLTVRDNGIGMDSKKIQNYILPKGSGKKIGKDYGFKGYGLTFATFVSKEINIISKFIADPNIFQIKLNGCFGWLAKGEKFPNGAENEPKKIEEPTVSDSGTIITVTLEEEYSELYPAIASIDQMLDIIKKEKDIDKLEYLLRSRTAIGNTRYLFGEQPIVPIDVSLEVIIDGKVHTKKINYSYFHPKDHKLVKDLSYDFKDYVNNLKRVGFIKDFKALYYMQCGEEVGSQRKLTFDVAICAISQGRLSSIEAALGINDDEDFEITSGIYLAINGMPTGIRIDNWAERGGAFLKRYFVIVDTDISMSEQLDPGRKGVSKYYANLISDHVKKMFGQIIIEDSDPFGKYAGAHLDTGKVTSEDDGYENFEELLESIEEEIEGYSKEEKIILEKIQEYSSLNRIPSTEQETIVLFYELLQQEIIKGYKTIYISGKATYDAAFTYKINLKEAKNSKEDKLGVAPAIIQEQLSQGKKFYEPKNLRRTKKFCIEFKHTIGKLLSELEGKTEKDPSCIDLLICWDIDIPTNISQTSYTLGEIHDSQRKYHGTTHTLGIIRAEGNTTIPCIVLKTVLEKIYS